MRNYFILAAAMSALVLVGAGCDQLPIDTAATPAPGNQMMTGQEMMDSDSMMEDDDSMMEDDDSMMDDGESMMEDDDSMMDDGESMMEDGESMMEDDDSMMEDGESMMDDGEAMMEDHAETKSFSLTGSNFKYDRTEIKVKKGDTVRLTLKVADGMHDWKLDEFSASTKKITTGQTDTIEFVADKAGTFEYYCSVGSHRQMGMVGRLIVE